MRDVALDLAPGRWVTPRHLLMRIVSHDAVLIEAYVSERQVAAISPGQAVRFFPHLPDRPVIEGEVLSVDRSPQAELSRPLLASIHGGAAGVHPGPAGALPAHARPLPALIKPPRTP